MCSRACLFKLWEDENYLFFLVFSIILLLSCIVRGRILDHRVMNDDNNYKLCRILNTNCKLGVSFFNKVLPHFLLLSRSQAKSK